MRPSLLLLLMTAATFAHAAPNEPRQPPVAVKTDHLPAHVARRVEAEAAQGLPALRRYVTITRGIYSLDLAGILVEPEPAPSQVARPHAAPAKVAREGAKER